MSNALIKAHIRFGEPCGEDAGLSELAEWAGELIMSGNGGLNAHQLSMFREIGEYLHFEEYNDESRKHALNLYFQLFDSVSGR